MKYNRVLKNPNWPEDFREHIQLAVKARLELEASELQVQRSIKMKAESQPPNLSSLSTRALRKSAS